MWSLEFFVVFLSSLFLIHLFLPGGWMWAWPCSRDSGWLAAETNFKTLMLLTAIPLPSIKYMRVLTSVPECKKHHSKSEAPHHHPIFSDSTAWWIGCLSLPSTGTTTTFLIRFDTISTSPPPPKKKRLPESTIPFGLPQDSRKLRLCWTLALVSWILHGVFHTISWVGGAATCNALNHPFCSRIDSA